MSGARGAFVGAISLKNARFFKKQTLAALNFLRWHNYLYDPLLTFFRAIIV